MDGVGPQGLRPRTYSGSNGTAEAVPFLRTHSQEPIGDPLVIRALYFSLHV